MVSTIQRISNKNGVSYRVFVRIKGLRTISKTFPNKQLAREFSTKLEGDRRAQMAYGGISNTTTFKLTPIRVKALYLTFWGASNNSKTLKRILNIIDKTDVNAIVMDVKNEYGSTSFLTSFQQANRYGAAKKRTNRDIKKFMQTMKQKNIYTIARIVTFKDELQASNNPSYAIKREDNGTIWRNHEKWHG